MFTKENIRVAAKYCDEQKKRFLNELKNAFFNDYLFKFNLQISIAQKPPSLHIRLNLNRHNF